MKCPSCDRKDFFSVSRKRSLVEFRMIKSYQRRIDPETQVKTKASLKSGEFLFDGNWKKEQDIVEGKLFLRCNACQSEVKKEQYASMGLEDIKITKKGIVAVLKHGFF